MKVKIHNGKICIVSKEYSDLYVRTVDVERIITIGEAIRLRSELDTAIVASQQPDSEDGKKLATEIQEACQCGASISDIMHLLTRHR